MHVILFPILLNFHLSSSIIGSIFNSPFVFLVFFLSIFSYDSQCSPVHVFPAPQGQLGIIMIRCLDVTRSSMTSSHIDLTYNAALSIHTTGVNRQDHGPARHFLSSRSRAHEWRPNTSQSALSPNFSQSALSPRTLANQLSLPEHQPISSLPSSTIKHHIYDVVYTREDEAEMVWWWDYGCERWKEGWIRRSSGVAASVDIANTFSSAFQCACLYRGGEMTPDVERDWSWLRRTGNSYLFINT